MRFHGTMKVNNKGNLEIGACDTTDLAKEFGTPVHIIDEQYIRDTCKKLHNYFIKNNKGNYQIVYASKAFLCLAMCKIINEEELGLDVASSGELYTAIKSGFPMKDIFFHGNNKSAYELQMALKNNIGRIVVDNFTEMQRLSKIAAELNKEAEILLRITPGIEAHTHTYIKTGQIDSKFGFNLPTGEALEAVKNSLESDNLKLKGLHCHIGSQIFEMESYRHAAQVMMNFINNITKEYKIYIEELNLGGGLGIYYSEEDKPASIEEYSTAIIETLEELAYDFELPIPKIIIEPGRSIVGPAGTTLYTVGAVKEIPGIRKYISVDGGMFENIRPALYGAKYESMLANKATLESSEKFTIAGKCCESGDILAWDVHLPLVEPGDILATACTGAYGYSMANNYNKFNRPPVVLVKDGKAEVIIKRESLDDLINNEILPERLL